MPSSYVIASQNDLAAAAAAIAAEQRPLGAAPAAYTLTLAADVAISGTVTLDLPRAGTSLTIVNAGHVLGGAGGLALRGDGTVVLAGNNVFSGGVTLTGGTLELAARGGAGSGTISVPYASPDTRMLVIDGASMPLNYIDANGSGGYLDEIPSRQFRIRLRDVAAATQYGIADIDSVLRVPTAAGAVALDGNWPLLFGRTQTPFIATGAGGTDLFTGTYINPFHAVQVPGANGGTLTIPFDDPLRNATVQAAIANVIGAGVIAGTVLPVETLGPALPIAPGLTVEAIVHGRAAMVLPDAPSYLVSDAPGAVSVTGGTAIGQVLLSGTGGLVFAAGAGQGSVVACGGANAVFIPAGAIGYYVDLGAGDDLVVATGGNNILSPGRGHNSVWLGPGANFVKAEGDDTIVGDGGNVVIDATRGVAAANVMAWMGAGNSSFYGGNGHSTVIGGAGSDFVSTNGGASQLWLGGGADTVTSLGADTIVAGGGGLSAITATGNAAIFAGAGQTVVRGPDYLGFGAGGTPTLIGGAGTLSASGRMMVFQGPGAMDFSSRGGGTIVGSTGPAVVGGGDLMLAGTGPLDFTPVGSATLIGNPGGSVTVHGSFAAPLLLYANGTTRYTRPALSYPVSNISTDTIIGQSGALTVDGASGALILGSPNGGNVMTVGGATTVVSGGSGDAITLLNQGQFEIYPAGGFLAPSPSRVFLGTGAATVSASGFNGQTEIVAGSGGALILTGRGFGTVLGGSGATTIVAPSIAPAGHLYAFPFGAHGTNVIQGFGVANVRLGLTGFPSNEVANALAGAVISGGDETLTLSDGTRITLAGFTGLTPSHFV